MMFPPSFFIIALSKNVIPSERFWGIHNSFFCEVERILFVPVSHNAINGIEIIILKKVFRDVFCLLVIDIYWKNNKIK